MSIKYFLSLLFLIVFTNVITVCQSSSIEQLLTDSTKQNELVSAIGHNHQLIMKIIDELSERPHFVQMMKERFSESKQPGGKSPYAGEESRSIKSLSSGEIDEYLNGEGMGLAKPAELNGYPGPKHVLDLAGQLQLTENEKKEIKKSYDRMHEKAVSLGKQIVEKERQLDKQFSSKSISDTSLNTSLAEIASLQGKLRETHLKAHLETKRVMSAKQIEQYNKLRGYKSK